MVKEFLETRNNIRDNMLSERTGEQQLRTNLSKFFRPITETQKATTREITEGLKPFIEGIQNLPQATQPLGEASGKEEPKYIGKIAKDYLNRSYPDETFGIRKEEGLHYIGNKQATIVDNNITIDDENFKGTPGLWELIMSKRSNDNYYTYKDYENYEKLMLKTNALYGNNDPKTRYPKSSKSDKWYLLSPIWYKRKEYEGKGVVPIPSNPNALLERLDILLASEEAGNTGFRNELVSICDEFKRQGVLDTRSYKKLNSIIKDDSRP